MKEHTDKRILYIVNQLVKNKKKRYPFKNPYKQYKTLKNFAKVSFSISIALTVSSIVLLWCMNGDNNEHEIITKLKINLLIFFAISFMYSLVSPKLSV